MSHYKTTKRSKLQNLQTRRKLWLKVHLWLGLSLGLFLAIIGLTGSLLVFWQDIDEALNPALYQSATTPGDRKPLDEIISAAQQIAPSGWVSGAFQWPDSATGNYVFSFYYPNLSPAPELAQSLSVAIDPFTASANQQRVFYHGHNPLQHSLVGFLFKLHYAFLLGESGSILVGVFAVLLIISLLSGLILWWPLTGKWRRALTLKRHASVERFNYDLHQTAGFYSLIVLLVLLVSGLYFNLPDQFSWLVTRFSSLTAEPTVATQSLVSPINLETALANVRQAHPGGTADYSMFNNEAQGLFTTCYKDVAELQGHVLTDRCLVLNRANGELIQIKDAAHGSAGDVFMQWQWPLHSGKAFGWTGRILVFIAGLLCSLLFVTGVIRWLQKRRGKQRINQRVARLG